MVLDKVRFLNDQRTIMFTNKPTTYDSINRDEIQMGELFFI